MFGRMDLAQLDATGVKHDAPEATVSALMTKVDQVIDRLNLIAAAIETATDGDSLFAALDVTTIKAAIKKITLTV